MNTAIDQAMWSIHHKAKWLEEWNQSKINQIYTVKGIPRPTYKPEIPGRKNSLGLMPSWSDGWSGYLKGLISKSKR